ncbi:hypothetical protein N7462_008312 [Penicillium macrosclerotiorum]|uniref:uncharacterized protein n=1 Tax=Penicillium macrosclerotiorum TaxID=303699 RepID=UPI002548D92A|nr:uncharacterized protein N7462_008312 [Penicillium macrosclerotiorum]KAJ5675415.1 hypothetical protein N7462_008312 [Penicillium macrosclerotiorum]
MDRFLSTVGNLLPYHLMSYGALLGTELYQKVKEHTTDWPGKSFVNTKICFQALPMREFIVLQKRIFPVYFGCQVGLTALTAATYPPYSLISLVKDPWGITSLAVVLVTGSLNWFVFGPRTTTTALEKSTNAEVGEETAESQENPGSVDDGKAHRANRNFARNHAMSIHLNAIGLIATVCYGFSLASGLSMRT